MAGGNDKPSSFTKEFEGYSSSYVSPSSNGYSIPSNSITNYNTSKPQIGSFNTNGPSANRLNNSIKRPFMPDYSSPMISNNNSKVTVKND
jgi:hypothetical protein